MAALIVASLVAAASGTTGGVTLADGSGFGSLGPISEVSIVKAGSIFFSVGVASAEVVALASNGLYLDQANQPPTPIRTMLAKTPPTMSRGTSERGFAGVGRG